MEKIAKIFDSSARVKIMRLFLFNDRTPYDVADIGEKSHVSDTTARREIKILLDAGFLKKKSFTKSLTLKPTKKGSKSKKQTVKKKKVNGWMLNDKFPLAKPFRELLIEGDLVGTKTLHKRFTSTGKIKMLVLSGIFVKDNQRSTDMILVGDKLDMKKVERTMRNLEAEIGKELRYSIFTTEEFQYRLSMYDQHLLDIFDYPHEKVVDKIGLLES